MSGTAQLRRIRRRWESMVDTYEHSRHHVRVGRLRAIYRAVRWELTGRYYPA